MGVSRRGFEIRRHHGCRARDRGNGHCDYVYRYSQGPGRPVQTVGQMSLGRYMFEMAPIYVLFVITVIMAVAALVKL